MKLKDGLTFEESKKMLIKVWEKVTPPDVDRTLIGEENIFEMIEKYWHGGGYDVLDFSVCWLFCYGNSGGVYEKFKDEIPSLWNNLFDIPYQNFVDFQTTIDNGEVFIDPLTRYFHKRRDKFRENINAFTFYDKSIRDFILMTLLYEK